MCGLQRVFGSALPTVEGIKQVLTHMGCSPSSQGTASEGKAQDDYQVLRAPAAASLHVPTVHMESVFCTGLASL